LYAHIHSNVVLSLYNNFNDYFDTSSSGYVLCKADSAEEAFIHMQSKVVNWNIYNSGNIFRFELVRLVKCPHCHMVDTVLLDASSGYYPSDDMIVTMIASCDTMVKLNEEDIANFNKSFL